MKRLDVSSNDCDPFSEYEPQLAEPSTKESIRSFWIGIAGLAILANVMICIELQATQYVCSWLWNEANKLPNGRSIWEAMEGLELVSRESLLPCIVLATVVPIRYWRGGLAQRFAISGVLVVAAMNSSVSKHTWWNNTYVVDRDQLRGLLAISGCWVMFPVLFLFTPINTRPLRLIVASCLLVLTFCVSVINMFDLRRSLELLYWESVFGSAFLYAVIRRNWGKVAMLESASSADQIERTSSRTLLELMTVSGLACASVMYWSKSTYAGLFLYFVQASILGIASVLVSMVCFRRIQVLQRKHIPLLVFLWLAMWILISANSLLNVVHSRYNYSRWSAFVSSSTVYSVVASACCASLLLLVHILVVGYWLRLCGWRIEHGEPEICGIGFQPVAQSQLGMTTIPDQEILLAKKSELLESSWRNYRSTFDEFFRR